ncbi:MAG: ATPase [Prevotellaceae bacterium]|jgi:N-acetylglucosamine kinase-like BadF-type ATPase|nr:ATPase [Prevotellaceae bacterium]
MKLIADSGSTKCDWTVFDENFCQTVKTEGFNPFFWTSEQIVSELKKKLLPKISADKITDIFFYGAGCRVEKCSVISAALQAVFPQAKIEVQSDLLGAARALFGNEKGIACILGTGSNSGLYNGVSIEKNVSPLGYILGDEGSGASLGKSFIAKFMRNDLPEKLMLRFEKKYKLTPAQIMENVYNQPFANRFLASFAPFLKENLHESVIYNLVFDSFTDFFTKIIMQYSDYQQYKISFCGSVAYNFADVLEVAALELNINLGEIIAAPTEKLILYHSK